MKLFWKLLAGMLAVMILSFAVFGLALLQSSFQTALDRETETALEEVRILQYALLAAAEGVEESYHLNERVMGQLAESAAANVGDSSNEVCVYNAQGESIYPAGQTAGALYPLLAAAADGSCVWQLSEADGHRLEAISRMECGGETYYLGVRRSIEYVYADREAGKRNYRVTLLVLVAFAAALSAAFAAGFTAPVRRLSQATRAFSGGNYEQRVRVRGNDEVAGLMQDFNRMADELERRMGELVENARRQEEFTGAFAHELKTPLTSMIGYGEMLMTMELGEEDRRQAADYIYRESRRLERLSQKMMELIRVGRLGIEEAPVRTAELCKRLRLLEETRVKKRGLSFSCAFEEAVLAGDPDLLLSLFGNLVDNAVKACVEGGSIRVEGRRQGELYRICVDDDGRGIPKEELGRITEAFYMVDKSRARKEGGAGLGMAICARIVEAHHARWEIASEPGQGTRVTVELRCQTEGRRQEETGGADDGQE